MEIGVIYDSIYSGLAMMDSQLQIWTTFTFALLVAVHVGGHRINRSIFGLAIGLYALYAGVLMLRNLSATFQVLHYQRLLVDQGLHPWPVPGPIGIAIGVGTLALLLGGTLATMWFARATYRSLLDVTS